MNGYFSLIDLVVVVGAAVVAPAALGRWTGPWLAVGAATALAVSVDPGPVGLALALPWVVLALAATATAATHVVRRRGARRGGLGLLDDVAAVAGPGFLVVAGGGLALSCGGLDTFGYGEPITRLAVVHFTYAGLATTALGRAALRASARRGLAALGLGLAVAAPPVVALGFATDTALPQVGGAVLMTGAAYLISVCHLAEGWAARSSRVGRLLLASGLSPWLPMALAVAWAAAQHTGGPALSIPDMARIHGSLNAFGFVGCGLAARGLASRPAPVPAIPRPVPA